MSAPAATPMKRPARRLAVAAALVALPLLGGCSILGWDDEEEMAPAEEKKAELPQERQMCLREYRLLDLNVPLCLQVGGVPVMAVPQTGDPKDPTAAPVAVVSRESLPPESVAATGGTAAPKK